MPAPQNQLSLRNPVALQRVVPDHRVVGDLVVDATPAVVADGVVLVDRLDVVDVGPETRSHIVVREVVPDDETDRVDELRAARLPVDLEAEGVVVGDLVSVDEHIDTLATDSDLPVVVHVVVANDHAVAGTDAVTVIPANLVGPHEPSIGEFFLAIPPR